MEHGLKESARPRGQMASLGRAPTICRVHATPFVMTPFGVICAARQVVTMESQDSILEQGNILVSDGLITAVGKGNLLPKKQLERQ